MKAQDHHTDDVRVQGSAVCIERSAYVLTLGGRFGWPLVCSNVVLMLRMMMSAAS